MEIKYLNLAAGEALLRAKRVLIVAHKNPDGDTLGAACAMTRFCEAHGIPSTAFCLDAPPEQYRFLPGTESFVTDPAVFGEPHDVLAVFDASDLRFAGVSGFVSGMQPRPTIIDFDHHATNERYGDINVVDTHAASTTEVVHRFFEDVGFRIDRETAVCILTGIVTDTGTFSNPSTTSSSLSVASSLLRSGANIGDVAKRLTRNKPMGALRGWGAVLQRLKYHAGLGVASAAVFQDDMRGMSEEHFAGLSNFLNQFLDARVILLLKEKPDGTVTGSFRTTEEIDLAVVATELGGGGHKKACGFTVAGRIADGGDRWMVVRNEKPAALDEPPAA